MELLSVPQQLCLGAEVCPRLTAPAPWLSLLSGLWLQLLPRGTCPTHRAQEPLPESCKLKGHHRAESHKRCILPTVVYLTSQRLLTLGHPVFPFF